MVYRTFRDLLKRGVNVYRDPSQAIWQHFFQGALLQFSQPNAGVGLASLRQEFPYILGSAASRADEGDHHGCITEIKRIWNSLFVNFFKF